MVDIVTIFQEIGIDLSEPNIITKKRKIITSRLRSFFKPFIEMTDELKECTQFVLSCSSTGCENKIIDNKAFICEECCVWSYCSKKCQEAHSTIHKSQCASEGKKIIEDMNINALKIKLNALCSIFYEIGRIFTQIHKNACEMKNEKRNRMALLIDTDKMSAKIRHIGQVNAFLLELLVGLHIGKAPMFFTETSNLKEVKYNKNKMNIYFMREGEKCKKESFCITIKL